MARPEFIWAFLAIPLLFLLYLMKPRPKQQTIPTLMFLLRNEKKKKYRMYLRYFIRDLLLLLQFLILLLLCLAIVDPLFLPGTQQSDVDTIFVLDNSASMYAREGGAYRYEEAKREAINSLGSSNTIILGGAIPITLLEDGSASEAEEFFQSWTPSHEPTKLAAAIQSAQPYISGGQRVVIISDFADMDLSADYEDVIETLRIQGAIVDTIQVGEVGKQYRNVGIVEATVREQEAVVLIKNYNYDPVAISLCGNGCTSLELTAGGLEKATLKLHPGVQEITIQEEDDFMIDNIVVFSTPTAQELRLLIVTNEDFFSSPLSYALDAIEETMGVDITIDINNPPTLIDVNHDVVIFDRVDTSLLVGQTVRQTVGLVANGNGAIIITQDDVLAAGYEELLPFNYNGTGSPTHIRNTQQIPRLSEIEYGSVPAYQKFIPYKSVLNLAESTTQDPLISLYSIGDGQVLFYNLPAELGFFTQPDYPLFWKEILGILVGSENVDVLNKKTGTVANQDILGAPDGVNPSTGVLSKQGVYNIQGAQIGANLLSAAESDIRVQRIDQGNGLRYAQSSRDNSSGFARIFVVLAILALFWEVLYMKWRGDL